MKVPLNWLKTMTGPLGNAESLSRRLDLTGTAVDGIAKSGASLDGIVVGKVLAKEPHPDADRLSVCSMDVGSNNLGEDGQPEPLQIVCGAQNFKAGDKVPVAMVGAELPGGVRIKKAKMRGVESRGMNCSARELGMGEDHEGLLILDAGLEVGLPVAEALGLSDTVLDLEITPNRPDCMSMLGVAREVAAITDGSYSIGREVATPAADVPASELVRVRIDEPERCARYTARIIRGVRVGPSPAWLAERVTAAGARSINNIVDVTNYIMFELGQPLHAFDLATLCKDSDGKALVVVRAAAEGEKFTTLDGVQRKLDSDITCIVDGNASGGVGQTVALAGVMGGLLSEVTETTTDILLESATFSTAHTSRTSRKLQLFSEASQRYERGVDGATCDEFSARAAALMAEVAGGKVCEGVVDAYPAPRELPELKLDCIRLRSFLGAKIANREIRAILKRLGCEVRVVEASNADFDSPPLSKRFMEVVEDPSFIAEVFGLDPETGEGVDVTELTRCIFAVTPPSFRPDLERPIDLVEEVLRVWGMDRVPATLPGGSGRIGTVTTEQARAQAANATLRSIGLNETMTYAFVPAGDLDALRMPAPEGQEAAELINPMSSEQGVMRRSIIPGLLRAVAHNQRQGTNDVQLYEEGVVFTAAEGKKKPKERRLLSAVVAGSWLEGGWSEQRREADFFDGKGLVEALARELCLDKLRFKALAPEDAPWLHPGRAAEVYAEHLRLGWLGELHPLALQAFDVAGAVVAFELEMKALLQAARPARDFQGLSQFPPVELDVALVVSEDVSAERAMQAIRSAGGSLLNTVRLFDVYRDAERLGEGRKSLAFSLSYRAQDRTLTSEEVQKLHDKVLRKACAATGGELRA